MMRGPFLLLLVLILSFSCFCCTLSDARHHHHPHKHPSALVVGSVYCDTCFQYPMSKPTHYISGATVAVECAEGKARSAFYQEVKTDKQGNFRVKLPFTVSKHVTEIQGCTVKLLKSSEPYCAVASTATSSLIHLKQRQHGKHIYSAGFFTFKPLKQPALCNQQPSITKSNLNLNSIGITLPSLPILPLPQIPTIPLPETPLLPLPGTPPLPITNPLTPTIPGPPLLPNIPLSPLPELPPLPPFFKGNNEKLENGLEVTLPQFLFPPLIPPVISPPSSGLPFPNPFSPPPLLPNPFQPPPSPLIPNPFQPPTPPPGLLPNIPGIPSIPGIIPSPPPPPPPSLFPPFFPPGFPGIGIPPAKVEQVNNHP
ncbi:uncharacterized protein LOC141610723 [Silene latifolia]|uniref:uncharacterized protein LOC141610723 n=1 Tax=Silene latifolia TaxID=37657 RepID=UPI003D76BDC1